MGVYYHFQNDVTKEIVLPHAEHNIKWYSPISISYSNYIMMAHLFENGSMCLLNPKYNDRSCWYISNDSVDTPYELIEDQGYKDVTEEKYNELVEEFGDRLPKEFFSYLGKPNVD